MTRKIIFLSHISEEGSLASLIKDRLEADFLSLIEVFVSSDTRSIPPGDAWLKAVDQNLSQASALIVLASPESVRRPWITFETGAGWARKVPTIILCHSGMSPGVLPLPLGQLQSFQPSDLTRLQAMYGVIASVLGSATPNADLTSLSQDIRAFEIKHTEARDILSTLKALKEIDPWIIDFLKQIEPGNTGVVRDHDESLFRKIENHLSLLKARGLIGYTYSINGVGFALPGQPGGGNFGDLIIQMSAPLAQALRS